MNYLEHYSLKELNTFGIECITKYYIKVSSMPELMEVLKDKRFANVPVFILGGGSNVLFTKDFNGLIIHIEINGVEVVEENDEYLIFKVGAGENWDKFVESTVNSGYGGLENLSFIPGTVGGSVVQNIGAYGKEIGNSVTKVVVLDRNNLEVTALDNHECGFSYRNSIFKQFPNKYVVTHVFYKVFKNSKSFSIDYAGIKERLFGKPINVLSVRDAIISIRKEKLLDPSVLGNAGCFFKNVEMENSELADLKQKYPKLKGAPTYNSPLGVKIPAAWLVDQCGFKGKGKRDGNVVGVCEKHALVLVNYGNGTGNDAVNLVAEIKEVVYEQFGIVLEPEVVYL